MDRILTLTMGFALAIGATAQALAADTVTCKQKDGNAQFQLVFDWTSDTATIARREGTGAWRKVFEKATAVRNGANDPALLAEGTRKEYVGAWQDDCGGFVEQLFFDLGGSGSGNKRAGSVTGEMRWGQKPGAGDCRPKFRVPESITTIYDVTCD